MSISEVTVKGTYKKADGKPETGTVKFRPALWQQSGSGIDAVLDSAGSFQTKFPSSDSGNWPDGLQIPYRVTVAVSSGTYVKELTFKTADSPIDLPTLFPIVSADSGGGGGSGGGVPAAHAATHSPQGSDPLSALLQIGNRLPWLFATAQDLPKSSGCKITKLPDGLGIRMNTATGTAGACWGGWTSYGDIVLPSGPVTFAVRAKNNGPVALTARTRLYWFDVAGPQNFTNGSIVSLGLGEQADISVTAMPPKGAIRMSLWIAVYSETQNTTPSEFVLDLSSVGWWAGAGGELRLPGEPIPGLGFSTTKLGNAELLSVWRGGKWVPLSGDTGTFTVGNGTIRRVGNSVYLTATGYTPPVGFRPAQGGTAPTNVWYVTADDWPTSAPGSAKL